MSDKERKTTRMETTELIEQVRQRPLLWDRNDPDYRNRQRKDKAWADVCRVLETTYDSMTPAERHEFGLIITRKWYNIRDCYKKYHNGTSRVSISGRPYVYANQLTFLEAIYNEPENTRKRKRYVFEGKESTGEAEETEEQEEWLNEVFVDMDTTAADSLPGPGKKIKTEFPRTKEGSETEENIVSVLVNLIEKEEDEDRAFFKSIIPTVKSLSDEDKFMFRIQVMKLLDALKKRDRKHSPLKRGRLSPESETE